MVFRPLMGEKPIYRKCLLEQKQLGGKDEGRQQFSMNVVAAAGEDDVIVALFPEGRREAYIDFVRFARGCGGGGVIADGIARLDAGN